MTTPEEKAFEEKFINNSFWKSGYQKQNEFRKQELFTDVILRGLDGTEFPVHKVVIATQCPYFTALFDSGLKECSQKIIQLDRNISKEILEQIIEYIYTAEICINLENAKILNEEAGFLELRCLKNSAAKVLEKSLNIENSLELWRYAIHHFNDDLSSYCLTFIQQNIETFFEKFLMSLTGGELDKILNLDFLISQEFLFQNIVKWLKNNFDNRLNYFTELIKKINFSLLSEDFAHTQILEDEMLMNNNSVMKILLNKKYQKTGLNTEANKSSSSEVNNIYVIANGWISRFEQLLNPRLAPIVQFEKCPNYALCEYNSNSILFSGGESSNSCINFALSTNKIEDFPSMIEERKHHSMIALNNKIYACGGLKNNGSVEIMDLEQGSWSIGKSLNIGKQYNFDIATLSGSIYAFGGVQPHRIIEKDLKLGSLIFDSKTVQRFDPRENIWYDVHFQSPIMRNPRCLCIDDEIYCFTSFSVVNIFDIRTNKWKSTSQQMEIGIFRTQYSSSNYDVIKQNQYICIFREFGQNKVILYDFQKEIISYPVNDVDMSSYHGGRINLVKLTK